jgi:DNA-directed RNA polymerase specialized sigma24 family protein
MGDDQHSMTGWIENMKLGDDGQAARAIWDRYFAQLARLAQSWLQSASRGVADGEDVALSAMDSFCRGMAEGRFPELVNRNELWKLLYTITARKAANWRRHEGQLKRGGGRVVGGGDLAGDGSEHDPLARFPGNESAPDLTATFNDEIQRLFGALEDESLRIVALLRMEGY